MNSFGRQIQNKTVSQLAELEKATGRDAVFTQLDSLLAELAARSLRGERIVTMVENNLYLNSVAIEGLSPDQRAFIKETYSVEGQQSRGAWYLAEKIGLVGGIYNLSWYFENFPRFPLTASQTEGGKVQIKNYPEAVFLWSAVKGLMDKLTAPIKLRSSLSGTLPEEELNRSWDEITRTYQEFNITLGSELEAFRPGAWKALRSAESKLDAKRSLLSAVSERISPLIGTYYRIHILRELAEHYYKKANAQGGARRKQVLAKPFQPHLSGFFGGDWLAFLDYLGETAHADEQIVTALPKPQINVGGAARAEEVAKKTGIPAEEVAKIAAALWQGSAGGASPIEERVECLKSYWKAFDEVHARQKPGLKPLWGLVEDHNIIDLDKSTGRNSPAGPQQQLYLELLPQDLIEQIERLWGTTMLAKYPDRIVSEPFPHYAMAQVFGPALSFWQNSALTAWFLSEGPYSRTDMAGLAHHQRRSLADLKEAGTPVDENLFEELIRAESLLGTAESIEKETSRQTFDYGVTVSMSMSMGSRRSGFEKLRDIITKFRRAWAEQNLERYLRYRWETEISKASQSFFLTMSEKGGKPPTLKQFAKTAQPATNNWFGGDISLFFAAIGEKSPAKTTRNLLMPKDKIAFVKKVAGKLPKKDFIYYENKSASAEDKKYFIHELARQALSYIQLVEAIGRNPTIKESGTKFTYRSRVLDGDDNKAWEIYERVIEKVLATMEAKEPGQKQTPPLTVKQSFQLEEKADSDFPNSQSRAKTVTPLEETVISKQATDSKIIEPITTPARSSTEIQKKDESKNEPLLKPARVEQAEEKGSGSTSGSNYGVPDSIKRIAPVDGRAEQDQQQPPSPKNPPKEQEKPRRSWIDWLFGRK